ncbi:50S ribosomal protein L30 [Fusibacter sp. 3D3]|uniref:50S ribosomal protein L30 n=1 Tax=Fusibacter sp. 3D3 TaxID=1048380 RepID=UPI000852B1D7|nr:50S ribosomal protein L30 [Fusibacter sp. 3D3]GAU79343.1 large subunit ribosomal protein L30p [Fusibacter sp. 3D3]
MATIKVKLVKSTIGVLPKHKQTVEALGLRKIGQVVEKQDNPQMRGMVNRVNHLVQIVE